MTAPDSVRYTKIPLSHGSGSVPALGFGTLIADLLATPETVRAALRAGFRHLDCAERYRNEQAVGDVMQEAFDAGTVLRGDVFVTLGHGRNPRLLDDPVIAAIAQRVHKTAAQVLLAWAVQRGTAPLTTATKARRIEENFDVSALPEDAVQQIRNHVTARVQFNVLEQSGGLPGFIPERM